VVNAHRKTHPNLKAYRPDIDGLRAIAVLSVLLFHAYPSILSGGFIGVDVFFVISGFLISGIIFRGLQNNNFSFTQFYVRRIRRIFPALIVVLLTCFIVGWYLLLPKELARLGKHTAASAGFVQNLVLQSEAGYFDIDSKLKILIHLWSLAIEEQFYIIFPLLVWLGWRARLGFAGTIVALALLSFGYNLFLSERDTVAVFFSVLTRMWELLAGGLLAWYQTRQVYDISAKKDSTVDLLRDLSSVAGLILLICGVILIRPDRVFPGYWALLPVMGSFIIIAAGPGAWINKHLLSHKPMVFIGLISYPLYLWHWPALTFARILYAEIPPVGVRTLLLAISVVLAWLTYRYVEQPLRFRRKRWLRTKGLCVIMTLVAAVGWTTHLQNGWPHRIDEPARSLLAYQYDYSTSYREGSCFLRPDQNHQSFAQCPDINASASKTLFLWGDSHAAHLYPGLRTHVNHDVAIKQRTASGCPPIRGQYLPGRLNCDNNFEFILNEIADVQPDRVVLAANWADYDWPQIAATISQLRDLNVTHIDVVGPVPQWTDGLPRQLLNTLRRSAYSADVPWRMEHGLKEEIFSLNDEMAHFARENNITYISPVDILCNAEGCLTRVGDDGEALSAWDYGHLTKKGSERLVKEFHLVP